MATITFLMSNNVEEREYLASGLDLLKAHGVIKKLTDVVAGTDYKYPNVSGFKNGDIPAAPKGFMAHFRKKYGKKIESLKDKPLPAKEKGDRRHYRDYSALENEIKLKQKEIDGLRAELRRAEASIQDKQLIIELLKKK